MDPSTQRLFQRVAEKLGWENPETLDRTAEELRKSLKSRRPATRSFDEDPSPNSLLSDSDSLEKENQSGNRNARSNRDFNQILADKVTPRRACKQISSAKKIREPIPVFSSDSDDDFEIFLSRVRTPKTQLRQQSVSGCDISLKHFIVDDLSSDDDFVVEKKNPPVSNGKLKHPKPPGSVPRLQKQTPSQYNSPVFLSDSDDDRDIRDVRQGGSTSQPSSRVKETQVKDHKLRGALHFPSPLTTDHTSAPSSALPTCSGRCNDTGSSDDEFLSLLDRIKKKQKLRSTSMQVPPKPPEELKATTACLTPSVKSQKGSDWAPVTESLVDRTREQLHISRPVSQSEPRTGPSSRMAVCKTSGCFLQSLSITGSVYCCNFKQNKQELTSKLYQLYNTSIFDSKLPTDMSVTWNTKMRKTAGYCITGQERVTGKRYARIELSVKVCDSADRLRDTLVHEMCHAATWLINSVRDGHGPFWKLYARKATLAHPELPMVTRCHSYDINYKYQYQCSRCKNTIGRHSKSLDTQKFVCALCKGQLVLLTPSNPRGPTPFAMFVKENYGVARQELAGQSHAEVMRKLSADFASKTRLSNS